jgi:hypothetical protein
VKFVIIDSVTLKVTNVCEWEGAEWLPPIGSFVVYNNEATFGDIYDPVSNKFLIADRTAPDAVEVKL